MIVLYFVLGKWKMLKIEIVLFDEYEKAGVHSQRGENFQ